MGIRALLAASNSVPPVVFPAPHSGSWTNSVTTTGWHGTPYDPLGAVDSVNYSVSGLKRRAYANTEWYTGNLATTNMNTFVGKVHNEQLSDTYVSFGSQNDIVTNYSMTFLGYFYVADTDHYDMYLTSDDESMIWIGNQAVSGFNGSNTHVNSNQGTNPNSLLLTGNKWYPIRIWYNEHAGGNYMQVFLGKSTNGGSSTLYSMNNWTLAYCSISAGLNL